MPTAHNEAKLGEIAKNVIMPGDPLRAEYIANNFLDNFKLVNKVRGIYAYTGKYKGKDVTVMASGMGMPSMGIYSYELFKFYNVENIIRIGSCGSYDPNLKLFDIILSKSAYTEGNFALSFNNDDCHIADSSKNLNTLIKTAAVKNNISIVEGNTLCTDAFDLYMTDVNKFLKRVPKDFNPISSEMEAFALFYIAKVLNKNASCLMSVVDVVGSKKSVTAKERETRIK